MPFVELDFFEPQNIVLQLAQPTEIVEIDGIWDLPLVGAERLDVMHRYQILTGGPSYMMSSGDGLFVNRPDGTWCLLYEDVEFEGERLPAELLPDDAVLVVRTAVLDDLKARVSQSSTDSPPGTRATLDATDGRSVDAVASPGSTAAPFDIAEHDLDTKEGRRRAVDAFLEHCNSEQPHVLRRTHIWRAARYNQPRSLQDW